MPRWTADPRAAQILVGAVLILGISIGLALLWLGRALPGLVGEWLGMIVGIASTPFLMESSFILVGLMIVFGLNGWRMRREGDECVYLEQVEGPDAHHLPEDARYAIYREPPDDTPVLDVVDAIEGALETGDCTLAAEILGELDAERLSEPAVMKLRIHLAEASGQPALADRLRAQLAPMEEK